MNLENIDKYKDTFDEYDVTIPGYFKCKDLTTFTILSKIQYDNDLIENALEIGVYYGRGVVHLSNLDYKLVTGIDLFKNQVENISQSGKCDEKMYERALIYFSKYGTLEKINIICDNSLNLVNNKFKNISFFHIDGGHSFKETYSDLILCKQNIIRQSIISIDDAFNSDWPDVTAAISKFLIDNENFKPLLISGNKIYLCNMDMCEFYNNKLIEYCQKYNVQIFDGHIITFFGNKIIKI